MKDEVEAAMNKRWGEIYGGRVTERYSTGWIDPRGNVVRIRPLFPRTEAEKVDRMERLMEFKIQQARRRWIRRIGIALLILLGTPLAIISAGWLWTWANIAVLG